ncbi:MAG: ABC transporter ATP-binding protein/permease [Promicromonosporaceae bacterium]|nr:ABC transporter ATP-binding protein/permease [Promicromonosporaceae bacterium]
MTATLPAQADPAETAGERNFRTLISFIWPHRGKVFIGALFGIIGTVANLWFPRITEYVIEALTLGQSVTGYVVAAFAVVIVAIVALGVQLIVLGWAGEGVVYDVRAALVRRILRGRVPDVLERNSGDLVSRATADAPLINLSVSSGFVSFVTALTGVIGAIAFMGSIDGPMLGITLGALLVLALFMSRLMPRVGRERAKAQEAIGELGGGLEGSIKSLRTIKALGAEGVRETTALESAKRARKHNISAMITEVLAYEVGLGGMMLVTAGMLGFGAWRVQNGHLSIAALVAFIMYAMNFMGPLMEIADGLGTIQSGLAAAKRVAEAQEIPWEASGELAEARGGEVVSTAGGSAAEAPIVEFRDVTAAYSPREGDVVTGLNLTVPRTGHVALVGPSGAGKTSVMSLMLRFLAPRVGEVLLDGTSYDDLTFAQVRERFAYVEQEPTVLPGTVRDNLIVAKPKATDEELLAALKAVHLGWEVADLPDGLDSELIGATMTGGTRQKLALGRALLRDPDVLLLDEPTSQISGATEDAIHEVIAAVARTRAVVTIAHRAETVQLADQVVLLDGGQIRATGTHSELLASDALYQELMSHLRLNDGE